MIRGPANAGEVRLEPGASHDLDAVMAVMETAFESQFGEAWTRSQCAGILPMLGVSLILARAPKDGNPAGFFLCRTVADEAELLLLAVAPEHQRRGIGRRLLDHFVACANAEGASRVHLEVRDGNPAVRMYKAAGFTPVGRRRNYYHGVDGQQFDALTLARQV